MSLNKYICTECTGRTDEEHTFMLPDNRNANHCPYCGQSHYIKTIEKYLRREIQDLKNEIGYRNERIDELEAQFEEVDVEEL